MLTPREQHMEMIAGIADRFRVPVADILGPSRYKHVVRARREVCIALRQDGLTTTQIGQIIGRDSTTVCNLLGTLQKSVWSKAA